MNSYQDTEQFIDELLKTGSKEMKEVDDRVGEAVKSRLRKFQADYGNLISHYDFEAFCLDIKQEVLVEFAIDCRDINKRKYFDNIILHIHFLTSKHVKRVFEKVMSNRGATLSKLEKDQIVKLNWPDPKTAANRTLYRIEDAFVSFEQFIEADDNFAAKIDVIDHETYDLISKAMSRLSSDHKSVVTYYFFEGLTQAEVANRMGVDVRTVYSKLKESVNCIQRLANRSEESSALS